MVNMSLLPSRFLSAGERLLHGRGVAAAVGAGRAEDWVRLDEDVFLGTLRRVAGWNISCRLQVGFHWFDGREIADWDTAPYWGVDGPSWAGVPTGSELALCLCHADPRIRAAALAAGGPAAPLPLLLLRCADNDERVRGQARALFAEALAAAGDGRVRSLVVLALRVGVRRHGNWARDAVLARAGGVRAADVRELLACGGRRGADARVAGVRAGVAAGLLDADALYRIALTADQGNRDRFEAVRAAVAAGRDTAARKRFLDFLAECGTPEVRTRALRYAFAARLPTAGDLAALAAGHRDRKLRRLAVTMVLDLPDADAVLDRLLAASDSVVRGTAVQRLAACGAAERLVPYLTDRSPWVRGLADRGLRAAGGDPHTRYRAWCADPEAVTPAAVSGLAEYRNPRDEPLLQALTRHADGAVRGRALGGLRRLGVLDDATPARYAADPDPHVVAVGRRGLRDAAPPAPGRPARDRGDAAVSDSPQLP
ncbi:hypothetical protein WDV06_11820 [Streptomyces racemochromogenes]|uniref:HEAT repeat protein n=1 Tax=Streptomyces racemochromogenes TaxID=67353 RepID=A0ABW7PBM6_9ACTN